MLSINPSDVEQLERRLDVCQAMVWAACNALEEYGDPTNAAAMTYSFEELREELERHKPQEACQAA